MLLTRSIQPFKTTDSRGSPWRGFLVVPPGARGDPNDAAIATSGTLSFAFRAPGPSSASFAFFLTTLREWAAAGLLAPAKRLPALVRDSPRSAQPSASTRHLFAPDTTSSPRAAWKSNGRREGPRANCNRPSALDRCLRPGTSTIPICRLGGKVDRHEISAKENQGFCFVGSATSETRRQRCHRIARRAFF